jgi:hypothetical protein
VQYTKHARHLLIIIDCSSVVTRRAAKVAAIAENNPFLCAAALVRWRGMTGGVALLVGGVVVSHWVLDFVTHAPDMPLWPGSSPRLGLGLWRSVPATLLVEGALFVAGIALYARATRPTDRIGSIGLWTFLLVSTILWVTVPWSRPPQSPLALAWFSCGSWLLVAWAAWADRHRVARGTA